MGGRSGVRVYKAGRSVPLDSGQLDLSRLALPQLGSAGIEKCFEIHDFFFQHAFFAVPPATAFSGTQNETVPDRGEIHLPNSLFENFKDVLAAQLPRGSILTSVACGPDSPCLKDCPGLGE